MDGHLKKLNFTTTTKAGRFNPPIGARCEIREGGQLDLPPESGGGLDGKVDRPTQQ